MCWILHALIRVILPIEQIRKRRSTCIVEHNLRSNFTSYSLWCWPDLTKYLAHLVCNTTILDHENNTCRHGHSKLAFEVCFGCRSKSGLGDPKRFSVGDEAYRSISFAEDWSLRQTSPSLFYRYTVRRGIAQIYRRCSRKSSLITHYTQTLWWKWNTPYAYRVC